ncbi:MAG: ribose-phosphate pyrophosphokinase-like domain-containing protein [Candidatus Obscuribacterales bacterium]|nr:ribose-phosphate pyrophosphokinase-like domain-containing protein [Candidatus Obscuribacterales bacterium]
MSYRKPILFSTSSYQPLAEAMLNSGHFEAGKLARSISKDGTPQVDDKPFPDGERYHCLLTDVEDREVIVLGGTIDDRETMELYDIANMLVDNFAGRLKLVIPYFGCSTQERAVLAGEAVKAKYRARMLSSIPQAAGGGNRIFLVDLHSEGIPFYFEGNTLAKHVYAKSVVIEAARDLARYCQEEEIASLVVAPEDKPEGKPDSPLSKVRVVTCHTPDVDEALAKAKAGKQSEVEIPLSQFCLASTDAGRAKWVESLARDMAKLSLPVHPAFIIKRRTGGNATEVLDISASVEGQIVIIYDDMIRTGGSLIGAADAYLKKGAAAVAAISTHGILPVDAIKRLEDSGKFARIIVTDSHPRALELKSDFLNVVSIASLLTNTLVKGKKK